MGTRTRAENVGYLLPGTITDIDCSGGQLPFKNPGSAIVLDTTQITALGSGTLNDTMIAGVMLPAATAVLHLYAWANAAGTVATVTFAGTPTINTVLWFPVDVPLGTTAATARGTVAGCVIFTKRNNS